MYGTIITGYTIYICVYRIIHTHAIVPHCGLEQVSHEVGFVVSYLFINVASIILYKLNFPFVFILEQMFTYLLCITYGLIICTVKSVSTEPLWTEEFVQFRQVFGVHRFKLHSQLVDGTVMSVWLRQVFGLLGVRFRQVFGLLGVWFRQVFGLIGVRFRQVFGLPGVRFRQLFGLLGVRFRQVFGLLGVRFRQVSLYIDTGEDVLSWKKCVVNHNKYVFGILSNPED